MPTARPFLLALVAGSVLSCVPEPEPFLALSGPKDVMKIAVTDEEGEPLWVVEADPPQTPGSILYGVVPPGFEQLEPATEPPRPLVPGEVLTSETTTHTRLFTHLGVARTPTTMVIIHHSMHLR